MVVNKSVEIGYYGGTVTLFECFAQAAVRGQGAVILEIFAGEGDLFFKVSIVIFSIHFY